jgi:hypothetical protein
MVDGRRVAAPASVTAFFEELGRATQVTDDDVAIRMGSALYSKARQNYHELEVVRGHPLVLAIEPFFDAGALWHGEIAFLRYLFGLRLAERVGPFEAVPDDRKLQEHVGAEKRIPSGFFRQPENSHVSAVIFSNSHTVAKFNRMGVLAGLAPEGISYFRFGYGFDPDPDSLQPQSFMYEVGSEPETWAEGLVVIHNPNATVPLGRTAFDGLTQVWEEDGVLMYDVSAAHIFTSVTFVLDQTGKSEPQ